MLPLSIKRTLQAPLQLQTFSREREKRLVKKLQTRRHQRWGKRKQAEWLNWEADMCHYCLLSTSQFHQSKKDCLIWALVHPKIKTQSWFIAVIFLWKAKRKYFWNLLLYQNSIFDFLKNNIFLHCVFHVPCSMMLIISRPLIQFPTCIWTYKLH